MQRMVNNLLSNWLSEPSIEDDSHKSRTEHTLDWLARSTSWKAKDCRRFLNESLSKFPVGLQKYFQHNLRVRWSPTFFELLVARLLQELGAELSFQTTNAQGKCPDFVVDFPDGRIIVEAIAPVFNAAVGEEAKNRIPLLDFIDSKIPDGWSVAVWDLPDIGPAESKKEFRRAVTRLLDIPPPTQDATDFELCEEIQLGSIRLHLWPGTSNKRRVITDGILAGLDDSETRIRHALRKKRRQVRGSTAPVLLAVKASGISSDFEDFDIALFGRTYESYNVAGELVASGFTPSGEFNNNSGKAPTYAGLLAFLEMGWLGGPSPVLYRHPRAKVQLPKSLLALEERSYDAQAGEIQRRLPVASDFMERIGFVSKSSVNKSSA